MPINRKNFLCQISDEPSIETDRQFVLQFVGFILAFFIILLKIHLSREEIFLFCHRSSSKL